MTQTASSQTNWRYWGRIIGVALGATSLTSLFTFIASTIFYRELSVSDAAQYGLFLSISQLLMFFCSVGQANYLRRRYIREPLGVYHWLRDIRLTMVIVSPMIMLASVAVAMIYQFPSWMTILLIICTILATFLWASSEHLASQQHYIVAGISQRIPNALMLLPALIMLVMTTWASLPIILGLQTITLIIGAGIIGWYQYRHIPLGKKTIPISHRLYGLLMVVGMTATLVPDYVLIAIGGLFLADAPMAAFLALNTLFRPVQLFHNVVYQITSTEVSRHGGLNYRRLFMMFGGLFVLIMVGGIGGIPLLSSLVYDGRYDFAHFIIPYIALANALDIAEILPRGYLYAHAPARFLNIFIFWQGCLAIFGTFIGFIFIGGYGLEGLALSVVVGLATRCMISYLYFWRLRRAEK